MRHSEPLNRANEGEADRLLVMIGYAQGLTGLLDSLGPNAVAHP